MALVGRKLAKRVITRQDRPGTQSVRSIDLVISSMFVLFCATVNLTYSLFELGYDARLEAADTLFQFSDTDRGNMIVALLGELPKQVAEIGGAGPVSFQELVSTIGNRTAATNADMAETLRKLSDGREIDVLRQDGGQKRPGAQIALNDRLRLSKQLKFFI